MREWGARDDVDTPAHPILSYPTTLERLVVAIRVTLGNVAGIDGAKQLYSASAVSEYGWAGRGARSLVAVIEATHLSVFTLCVSHALADIAGSKDIAGIGAHNRLIVRNLILCWEGKV